MLICEIGGCYVLCIYKDNNCLNEGTIDWGSGSIASDSFWMQKVGRFK